MEDTFESVAVRTLLNPRRLASHASTKSRVTNNQSRRQNKVDLCRELENLRLAPIQSHFKPKGEPKSESKELRCLTVQGNDIPTEYTILGLKPDELPVIGTYVHPSINPGFKYSVRRLGRRSSMLYDKHGLYLLSISAGYGKRINFESNSLNTNDNYFYSDSCLDGFGFTLVAISAGDKFLVCDELGSALGEGEVDQVDYQKETKTVVDAKSNVVKHVAVTFTCHVRYGPGKHGLVPLCSQESLNLEAAAILVKPKRARKGYTKTITDVVLPNFGPCNFKFGSK